MTKHYLVFPIATILLMLFCGTSYSQTDSTKLSNAEKLRTSYQFEAAIKLYKELLEVEREESNKIYLQNRILLAENGIKLLGYAHKPELISSVVVPRSDFYLYYPILKRGRWVALPESMGGSMEERPLPSVTNAILYEKYDKSIIYSSRNSAGNWDLFISSKIDSVGWSAPQPLGDEVNTIGDEIFPYISQDGERLYFTSNGHPGMGGFDLFVSIWDSREGRWGVPQNMGFPYSTTANDLLFVAIDDEMALFTSDRDNGSADSIKIYLIAIEKSPITFKIEEHLEISNVANLEYLKIKESSKTTALAKVEESSDLREYLKSNKRAISIKTEIDTLAARLNIEREIYRKENNRVNKANITSVIRDNEQRLLLLTAKLDNAIDSLVLNEIDLHRKGITITAKQQAPATESVEEKRVIPDNLELGVYHQLGNLSGISIIKSPEPESQPLKFRTNEKSSILRKYKFPDSVVYTIKLFAVTKRATEATFKNLNPVIELSPNKKDYVYYSGVFYSVVEMEKALATVKSMGFKKATGIAVNNGKFISLKQAELLQNKRDNNRSFRLNLGSYSSGIPNNLLSVIRKNTDKDIAKKVENGEFIYFIGPFRNRAEVENLLTILKESGIENTKLEIIE